MKRETKVIAGIGLFTLVILVGGIALLSVGQKQVNSSNVISKNGLHWHPKLSIFIKDEQKPLDDGIGLGAVHQSMHTHTEDYKEGVVHMEMKGVVSKDDTKLGKFFQVWGKKFNSQCILDQCATESGTLKMTVNDQENAEYENYLMKDGDRIEIRYE